MTVFFGYKAGSDFNQTSNSITVVVLFTVIDGHTLANKCGGMDTELNHSRFDD